MKKYLTSFNIATNNKKRIITTYRANQDGQFMRSKHISSLQVLEENYSIDKEYSFAYIKEQSIKQLVSKHLNNRYFYQFDISKFFGSIDHDILLEKLNVTDDDFNQTLIRECSNNKPVGLALGLIPSPYLSNIYLATFDQQLVSSLSTLDSSIVYTRYSDDLTISSNTKLDIDNLQTIINQLLATLKLELNPSKTRYSELLKKGQHTKILGLNIIRGQDTNYITVGRKFKRNTSYEFDPQRKSAMEAYIYYNEH